MTKNNINITTKVTAEKLGLFYEFIPVAISLTTPESGELVFVNKYFEKLFVCKRKDILGKKLIDLNIFSDDSRLNLNQKVSEKGVLSNLKIELTLQNLKKINALISVEKIDLDNQQFFISTITDVTEKAKSTKEIKILNNELGLQNQEKYDRAKEIGIANIEQAQQQSEKFDRESELLSAYKELSFHDHEKLKCADELIQKNEQLLAAQSLGQFGSWDWDIALNKLEWSDELYRIYGLEPTAIELTCENFIAQIHVDDRIHVKNKIKKACSDKKPFSINHRVKLPKNQIREIRITGKAYLDNENKIVRMAGIAQDVSEKKQGQLQAYSRSLIEASRDPLITISPQGKITDVNKATIRATGISQSNLIGSYFYNYFTEPDTAKKIYEEVFEKGFVVDYPLILKDNNFTDVLFNGSVYKDENNQVIGAVVVARDITEQKKLERNLTEYKYLFNENLDFACIANADGVFEKVNTTFTNVLGYSSAELVNHSVLKFVHKDDIEATKKIIENLKMGIPALSFINRYKTKKGNYVLLDWKSNFNKNTNKIYAIAREITDQKKNEQNLIDSIKEISDYKFALDNASIVGITDAEGKITYINDNFEKISQYTAAELIGSNHYSINSHYHSKNFMSNLWKTITGGKIWKSEIKNKAKDGSYYWVNSTIVPFLNESGIPERYIAISIDITNQKKLEQELIEAKVFAELATKIAEDARKNAEEAAKSKQQFLSNMSHEIRTPMNAIIGFTKVVLKTELTAKQKEYLMAIKISGDALIVLINDILDLAKVDSGKMTFEKAPFKLSLSIASMLHLFKEKIQEKNLHLVTKYDTNIPDVLLGDTVRLNQIVLNLVSNAVKFTQKGKITVAIKMLSQDQNSVKVKFSVADTGIGIKSTKVGEIFENFQQANNTTSRLYGGTGLGLAIVKQLVEGQGGTIDIKSQVNKGSTFTFVLDFEKSNVVSVLEPEILEFNTDVKDIKILVVEDMELNQLLMKTLLDDFGFECEIASNGKLAIEKLKVKSYDIILMDLQMPEMNGFEATAHIRKKMKLTIPIIALTADVTTADVEKCKSVGMNDYVAKPVDERLLYSKLISFSKKPILIIEHTKGQSTSTDTVRYVDLSYLQKLTKSDPNLMSQLIKAYLKQTPPLVDAMKRSLVDKDWKALKAAVHKIIPSFSIIGLSPDIHEIAKKIQEYAFSIEISEEIHKLVLELENVCEQSCVELELELNNLKL